MKRIIRTRENYRMEDGKEPWEPWWTLEAVPIMDSSFCYEWDGYYRLWDTAK